jgi:hypothetical protein
LPTKNKTNEDFKKNLLYLLLVFCMHIMNAQTKSISGKVTDSSGFPLAGTTILVKELNPQRSQTNGNYNIKTERGKIQIYSFIG